MPEKKHVREASEKERELEKMKEDAERSSWFGKHSGGASTPAVLRQQQHAHMRHARGR